jgi:adenine-specific DNA-methyltransferase
MLIFTRRDDEVSVSYKQYLYDAEGEKRGIKPFSIIDKIYTQQGTADLNEIFDDQLVLQFPKPVNLLKQLLNISTEPSEGHIVIDFFAGSCTMAQAVLELNREDNGNRRFIMIQLPEPTSHAKFPSIADIGKERIRRVIKKMQQTDEGQLTLETPDEDLGFKVFKLAGSNFRPWKGTDEDAPEAYAKQMALFTDPLMDGWQAENVIYEVALKEGYSLNSQIKPLSGITGNVVYQVTGPDKEQSFTVCLDGTLHPETQKALSLDKEDLFVCRDIALDDETAANLALQCRLKII